LLLLLLLLLIVFEDWFEHKLARKMSRAAEVRRQVGTTINLKVETKNTAANQTKYFISQRNIGT
jgi:hypothetical protein